MASKLNVPRTLTFVVVAASFAAPWVACDSSVSSGGGSTTRGTSGGGSAATAGGSTMTTGGTIASAGGSTLTSGGTTTTHTTTTTSEPAFCVPGPDAGPNTMCPEMLDAGEDCPPGCQIEVI